MGKAQPLCPTALGGLGGPGPLQRGHQEMHVQNGTTGHFLPEPLKICPETSVDVLCNKLGIKS